MIKKGKGFVSAALVLAMSVLSIPTCQAIGNTQVVMFNEKDVNVSNVRNIDRVIKPNLGKYINVARSLMPVRFRRMKDVAIASKLIRNVVPYIPDVIEFLKPMHEVKPDEAIKNLEKGLKKLIGQEKQKSQLKTIIDGVLGISELSNGDSKGHVIYMAGPSGVGKTYSAEILARAINGNKDPYVINPVNIDFKSEVGIVRQLFGIKKDFWDIISDNTGKRKSLIDYIERTKHPVVIINEYDKMYRPDLDEIFRAIMDNGKINIDGKEMDFSGTIFIITSNESHNSLMSINDDGAIDNDGSGSRTKVHHDKSFMNRVHLVEFDNLCEEDYKEITKNCFSEVARDFEKKYKISVNIDDTIDSVARKATSINQGSRPIINDLRNGLVQILMQKRRDSVEKGTKIRQTFKVYYDDANDEFDAFELDSDGNRINETKNKIIIQKEEFKPKENDDKNDEGFKGKRFGIE